MCSKAPRTDHMSRHFSTHIPQVIAKMSKEAKDKHNATKNVIVMRPTDHTEQMWYYCTVCKHMEWDEIQGQVASAWYKYHSKGECKNHWNKVQHLFNDGIVYRQAGASDSGKANELKIKVQMLEAQITKVLEDLPLIMNYLNPGDAAERIALSKFGDIIAYLNGNEYHSEEE